MKRLIFIILSFTLSVFSAFSQSNLQTIATVNLVRTESITVGQLRAEVERYEAQAGRALTLAERRQVLDAMIDERLVMQAAERDRIVVTDNEINQHFNELRSMLAQNLGRQPTEAEFAQAVRNEFGMDVQAYREQAKKTITAQKYLMEKKGTLINSVRAPTEQDIQNEYNMLRAELVRPETVRVSMIRIPYGADAAARTRARELGNRLIQEIASNPSRFDEVAARGNTQAAGYEAGDAGFLPRNQEARQLVGQNFMDTAFSLRQGQVSTLIEGPDCFYIIKVTENYTYKNLELDDIYQLGTNVTVRNLISQSILNQRQQALLVQASEELTAELRAGRSFQIMENYLNW